LELGDLLEALEEAAVLGGGWAYGLEAQEFVGGVGIEAGKSLPPGVNNIFLQAAAAYEATDQDVAFVSATDRALDRRGLNSDRNPRTGVLGRTLPGRILIRNDLGAGDLVSTAAHEILVHGQEKSGVYLGDLSSSARTTNRLITQQLPASLYATQVLFRRWVSP
jgi:hypothetical protein